MTCYSAFRTCGYLFIPREAEIKLAPCMCKEGNHRPHLHFDPRHTSMISFETIVKLACVPFQCLLPIDAECITKD